MLPVANLSLLVYLLGFFTQLPLCPENGIQPDDITRIFGHPLIGGKSKSDAMKLMLWLLRRWPTISEHLFAQSTTAWEGELNNLTQSTGGFSSAGSKDLIEFNNEHNRIRHPDCAATVMEERPRYGLYQFAATGFPASRDLCALSQGVACEEENPIVDPKITDRRKRGDCSPFDLDRIEDWRTLVTGERPPFFFFFLE
jgi:hypothetical protein